MIAGEWMKNLVRGTKACFIGIVYLDYYSNSLNQGDKFA
jgi:hypothetical protein